MSKLSIFINAKYSDLLADIRIRRQLERLIVAAKNILEASSISGANLQDTTASNLILDDGDLRQAGAPEPTPNVGSVPNDQIAALAAAVAQIQQALAKQQLNNDIRAQEAASSLPSGATTDTGHHSAENDLKELQRLPQSLSYDIDNPCAYQHAKAQFKPVAEKMLAKDTRSVGELYKWLRSFRNFASTICVQNPVCFAILHLRDPAETWAQNRSLENGTLRLPPKISVAG